MKSRIVLTLVYKILILSALLTLHSVSFSQNSDTTNPASHFGGIITLTSKGISMVPNLSLGKPAVMFDMSMGKGKLSFEPQLRFALEGKPWSFIFWWRYKLIKNDKFLLNIGAHPALSFKTYSFLINELPEEHMVVRRYLAGELAPTYFLRNNISFGLYYLYSYGVEEELTRNTNMVSVRGGFSDIRLTDKFYMNLNSQVYYLNMDNIDGTYFNATLTLARRDFPISISALINQPFRTNIAAGNEFLWNVSLVYTFVNEYLEK